MTGLINLMEETVLNKIDQLLPGTDYCKCEHCRMDMAAYALNRLPAQYVQSMKGKCCIGSHPIRWRRISKSRWP